jgi:hypothetical protein
MAALRIRDLFSRVKRTKRRPVDIESLRSFYLHSDDLVERYFTAILHRDLSQMFADLDIPEDDWAW